MATSWGTLDLDQHFGFNSVQSSDGYPSGNNSRIDFLPRLGGLTRSLNRHPSIFWQRLQVESRKRAGFLVAPPAFLKLA